jgi:hypothetical protein
MRGLTIGRAEGSPGNSEIKNINKPQKFHNTFRAITGDLNVDTLKESDSEETQT